MGAPVEQAVFIREGFSLGAFLFTVVWALTQRMWISAAGLVFLFGMISLADQFLGLGEWLSFLASFVVSLLFGFEARDLQARALASRGWRQIGLSHGRDIQEAELRYFSTHQPSRPTPTVVAQQLSSPRIEPPDTLGIFSNV